MSSHREITISCPKCKQDHPFVMWHSINTTLNPEMKAAVKLLDMANAGDNTQRAIAGNLWDLHNGWSLD